MKRESIETRARVIAWLLDEYEELCAGLVSRASETASLSGWDESPERRPCEHRSEWRRGKLCLGCDNTGWRPLTEGRSSRSSE
jgi:hypothetical protein